MEQLKSIANPLRLKILAELSRESLTTKQVAKKLGEPPTRLYHHVEALAANGLLVLEKEIPKRGTTEKYYRAVARQIRVGEQCLSLPGFADEKSRVVIQLLDLVRTGMLEAITGQDEAKRNVSSTTAAAGIVELAENDVEDFSGSILNVIENWEGKKRGGANSIPSRKYRVAVFIYPDPED